MGKRQNFSIKKHRIAATAGVFLFALASGIYIYYGFQPAPVDALMLSQVSIPSIGLTSDVQSISKEDNTLVSPERIVGAYTASNNKTLLIGHKATVFTNLDQVKIGNIISYNGTNYQVTDYVVKAKEDINMDQLLAPTNQKTLVLMTCYGDRLEGNDYTHRIIITAKVED